MIKIGFAKQDLEAALSEGFPVREERIEAIAFYVESVSGSALWIVLDFMDFDLHIVNTIQAAVCDRTGLTAEHVHIVTTHNHGGGTPDLAVLASLSADCAEKAESTAQPARMRYAAVDVERQVSILRRKAVPELEGVTTLFYGASSGEDFDSAPFAEHAVHCIEDGYLCYCGREDTERAFDPFASGDREVFAIQFQAEDGTTIGTVLRFAAHAVCSNLSDSYSSDYPWHTRRKMEEYFGGTALFFNGPCGDIAPAVVKKADGTQRILGEYIAETAIAALCKQSFEEVSSFVDSMQKIVLPTRTEVLQNHVTLSENCPTGLPERRKYLEKEYLGKQLSFLRSKALEAGKVSDGITVSFGMLRFNNLVIAGFPGETFSATGKALKAAFPDKDICTVTEHGRTVMYLPPMEEYVLGGYESVCMSTQAGAEGVLRENSLKAIAKLVN